MKITNLMKDAVIAISKGEAPLCGTETLIKCIQAGLLDYENHEYFLTPKGSKLASERKGALERQKARRKRSARARHQALTGLGLTRTRSGTYESIEEGTKPKVGDKVKYFGVDGEIALIEKPKGPQYHIKLSKPVRGEKTVKVGEGAFKTMSGESIEEGAGGIESCVRKHLDVGNRQVIFRPQALGGGGVNITYINLPEGVGGAGGGAEAMNNRFLLTVDPAGPGKVKVETLVNSFDRKWRMRARTGTEEKVGKAIAMHLNKIAKEVPPKFTHTRQESLRPTIGALRDLVG